MLLTWSVREDTVVYSVSTWERRDSTVRLGLDERWRLNERLVRSKAEVRALAVIAPGGTNDQGVNLAEHYPRSEPCGTLPTRETLSSTMAQNRTCRVETGTLCYQAKLIRF